MFKNKRKAKPGSYKKESIDSVQLRVQKTSKNCLRHGTISFKLIKLENSVHLDCVHETLASAGQFCDQKVYHFDQE